MLQTRVAVAAQKVIVDFTSHAVSLIDLVEDFQAQAFPVVLPQVALLWYLERDPAVDASAWEGTATIALNGERLTAFQFAINFQDQLTTRAMVIFGPVVISSPGRMVFTWSAAGSETTATYETVISAAAGGVVNPPQLIRVAGGGGNGGGGARGGPGGGAGA